MVDRATFVGQIRDYLRDHPQFNALLDDFETSDSIISLCADLAADDFANSPPLIGRYIVENHPSMYLLFLGTLIQVLRSAGFLQARNNLNYSDGGLTVATSDKAPIYNTMLNNMMQEYEGKKRELKKSMNAMSAYGGIASEYMFIGAYGQYLGLASMDSFTAVRYGFFVF